MNEPFTPPHQLQGGEPHLSRGPLGPSTGSFQAPFDNTRNVGPGDDDYGRNPKSWKDCAPLIDQYNAGSCPVCGEFAVQAERRPDGRVACRHGHWRDRRSVSVDPAVPGGDTNVEQHTVKVIVSFIKRVGDPTCQMRVVVPDAPGEAVAMAVNMSAYPTDEERRALVAGIAAAARSGVNNIDFKIRNPVVSDIVDRFFKRL